MSKSWVSALIVSSFFFCGCAQSYSSRHEEPPHVVVHATYTSEPIILDGDCSEKVWQTAPIYPLARSQDQQAEGAAVNDQGYVQLAHDDNYLYVAILFEDKDVVAEGDRDQLHHYSLGDVAEVFLKPARGSWYWEMYATPLGYKTIFFYPSRGRLGLPSGFDPPDAGVGFRVAAKIQGTCNDWRDRDSCWTAEVAIAKTKLSAMGIPFNSDESWTILVGRYNYSRYLANRELTMYPTLSKTDFHQHHEYASLVLDPAITK
jgi:hypothetical protein